MRVSIAILARAPMAGTTKTRLIPALGASGAARLHRRMALGTVAVARQAGLGGNIVLWGTPASHRFFRALARSGLDCRAQPEGDLGARMRAALLASLPQPTLLLGTDCPCLGVEHLRTCAQALLAGQDAVFLPAEDGGYGLIGLNAPARPELFEDMPWGTDRVMAETRRRLRALGYAWSEPARVWDVDTPADLARLRA
jgi:rSAM/selenodomain-associated transferase 1